MDPGLEKLTLLTYPGDYTCPTGQVCPRVAIIHIRHPLPQPAESQRFPFNTLFTERESSIF